LPQKSEIILGYRMVITDQVATAPCTDPIQVRFLLLRAKLRGGTKWKNSNAHSIELFYSVR